MEDAHVTELIIEIFRLNGDLLNAGDRLVSDVGLTSARWQVLGAIDLTPFPLTVAQIARNMGLSRQAVQRLSNALATDGLVTFIDNPQHVRAKHVVMSEDGKRAFARAMSLQRPWAEALVDGVNTSEIRNAVNVLRIIREKIGATSQLMED